jgi:hypothetical protein
MLGRHHHLFELCVIRNDAFEIKRNVLARIMAAQNIYVATKPTGKRQIARSGRPEEKAI